MGAAAPSQAAAAALLGLTVLLGAACDDASSDEEAATHDRAGSPAATAPLPASARPASETPEPTGDAARGKDLVERFECARCHDGIGAADEPAATTPVAATDAPLDTKHCFSCHADILAGRLDHKPDAERWKKNVAHLVAAPSLTEAGARLRYDWMVGYLVDPHDLRPNLAPTMPPLSLDRQQARDIATYLTSLSEAPSAPIDLSDADPARGRQLLEDKGCASCHRLGGATLSEIAGEGQGRESRVAVMLAPDLRFARDRWSPAAMVRWIRDPLAMKPDTPMPQTPMSEAEAQDIAAYLLNGELEPVEPPAIPTLPPPLERRVTYQEVADRVLNKTCRHCHGDPDVALGDGGPGNTGGFGYPPRRLELTSYERVSAGYVDQAGDRRSVFSPIEDGTAQPGTAQHGTARLVASLLARHAEIAGQPSKEVRGMPLGLPPLPIEDIQLVASWIAQGRPQ